ncbi:MAG: type IV pili methyl-accepting chemotaxis transducer N-terminal domain-containing protein [Vitreoscilla sp.]|nr:type IV pili methyl-accepting chemotaxis transducer N-terminal domain-containing protein [Vitreoscilla sp.]
MDRSRTHWTLGAKLALMGLPFLLLGLLTTALTLWVSWQLDGGAAAVNEAGRMRMQVYRMAWLAGKDERPALAAQLESFDSSLVLLRHGDPERPLVMPWDDSVRLRFEAVQSEWAAYRHRWAAPGPALAAQDEPTTGLVERIDQLVTAIEAHLSRFTSLMHLLQLLTMTVAVIGSAVLVVTGYRYVLEPVTALKQAIGRVREGDFEARVQPASSDEFGALAEGFNDMAEQLHTQYQNLEARVAEKTFELKEKRERLEALYDVSTLVMHTATLEQLAQGFTARVRAVVGADAAALRWTDESNQRFVMLASDGLPTNMLEEEHCIRAGDCHCGVTAGQTAAKVVPIHALDGQSQLLCERAGWATVVAVPIRLKERLIGELDLFFTAERNLAEAERSLLDALTVHLASGMENLRLNALEKEAAVAQERGFIARELHDSIAQSLAFLKIQVQLMRDAMEQGDPGRMAEVLAEIELGVRESHGDVRELLMHFRTRTNTEDIEPALHTTLRKFEHQTGIATRLALHGQGLPLPPDMQIQALHIVQEALSNVRKHARASEVWLDVWRQPVWRFVVRDDGIGFDAGATSAGETHVGLGIMAERAERLHATLEVRSQPGSGTTVSLVLPPVANVSQPPAAPASHPMAMN